MQGLVWSLAASPSMGIGKKEPLQALPWILEFLENSRLGMLAHISKWHHTKGYHPWALQRQCGRGVVPVWSGILRGGGDSAALRRTSRAPGRRLSHSGCLTFLKAAQWQMSWFIWAVRSQDSAGSSKKPQSVNKAAIFIPCINISIYIYMDIQSYIYIYIYKSICL